MSQLARELHESGDPGLAEIPEARADDGLKGERILGLLKMSTERMTASIQRPMRFSGNYANRHHFIKITVSQSSTVKFGK